MKDYRIDINDRRSYPIGVTRLKGGLHAAVESAADNCNLLLYPANAAEAEPVRVPFPRECRTGNIWEMTLYGNNLDRYVYAFEAEGKEFPDPCGASFTGHEEWGDLNSVHIPFRTPLRRKPFDWEGDAPLHTPYEDCIVYRAHVRGFTKHPTSGVSGRGTFRGIVEKIPYLKELGITTLELLPVAEFQEVMMPEHTDGNPYGEPEPTGKINYWGYARAYAYAPKASYAGKHNDPVTEFKKLVKALHQAGIEIVIETFWSGKEAPAYVLEAVRYWVREYHIDGVHFTGYAPLHMLAKDPYLANTKLWASHWDAQDAACGRRYLAEYNEDFLNASRHILKGDEDQMRVLADLTRSNPAGWARMNFLAGTNGYTLNDMVMYEQKHNEANGEDNRDGNDYNHTWNCGEEGPTRKKKILERRRRQVINALLILFLSQGTPVLMAGDEFGNSQDGNNNAYCQDNAISWLNWRNLKTNKALFEFTKALIAFRKSHPVFHQPQEPLCMDYLACGHPDMSFHGSRAWVPEYEAFRRQLGVYYCGAYGKHADGSADHYFYVAYNMHWEPFTFALPNLPKPLSWHEAVNSGETGEALLRAAGTEPELSEQKVLTVEPRTVVVLAGIPGTLNPEKPKPAAVKRKPRKALTNTAKTDINGNSDTESKSEAIKKTEVADGNSAISSSGGNKNEQD